MLSFRDLGQKWWPKVEALLEASMENEEEESYVREGEEMPLQGVDESRRSSPP